MAASAERRVLVVGDVMMDTVVRPAGPIRPGVDTPAAIRRQHGGSAGNLADWLAFFHVPVTLAARVGAGDVAALSAHYRARGVEPLFSGDRECPTGEVVALIAPDGERHFLTDRGANDRLAPEQLPPELIEGFAHLHVSAYAFSARGPRAAVRRLIAAAGHDRCTVSIDVGSALLVEELGRAVVLDLAGASALVFANAAEAAALAGSDDPQEQRRAFAAAGLEVVIKRGAAGADLLTADGALLVATAPKVEALDSTGAGDAFAARFLAARLDGRVPDECLRLAVAAGADAVTRLGGRP